MSYVCLIEIFVMHVRIRTETPEYVKKKEKVRSNTVPTQVSKKGHVTDAEKVDGG